VGNKNKRCKGKFRRREGLGKTRNHHQKNQHKSGGSGKNLDNKAQVSERGQSSATPSTNRGDPKTLETTSREKGQPQNKKIYAQGKPQKEKLQRRWTTQVDCLVQKKKKRGGGRRKRENARRLPVGKTFSDKPQPTHKPPSDVPAPYAHAPSVAHI